ncbi:DNA translocase FtsK [Bacillota bacterium Lsc_1132]
MSWLQNFFQMFRKHEEEQLDEEEFYTHQSKSDFSDRKNDYKEMDARITYQYPKGKFRFPIIPDEIHPLERKPSRQGKPNPANEEKAKNESQPVKKQSLPKMRSAAPFRPTEIPSPIFGFQRPKRNGETIEHELSHFSSPPIENVQQKLQSLDHGIEIATQKEKKADGDLFPQLSPLETDDAGLVKEETAAAVETAGDEQKELRTAYLETKQQPSADQAEGSAGVNETNFSETPLEQKKQRRQHLPFNVMMLKSDKKRWEERKTNYLVSSKNSPLQGAEVKETWEGESTQSMREHAAQQNEERERSKAERSNSLSGESQSSLSHPEKTNFIQSVIANEERIEEGPSLFQFPGFHLLNPPVTEIMDVEWVEFQQDLLNQTLQNFNVGAKVVNITQGPSVTRFEVQPEPGVKVNKVTNLTDDIKLSLAARDIRIEAPIPGKHTIGIEVPNQKSRPVFIREIIQSDVFTHSSSPLTAVLGLDISGKPIVTDLKKMPHGLIAGATGSGKSVCINSILVSLLYKASPEDVKLLLIDPKMVELAPYNRIPHLVSPVITDVKAATAALKWAVDEMERRYELFAHTGVRDINRFNELAVEHGRYADKLPFIVIVIDELADLMMMSPADVEEAICRIAQKARACGIHLIIATQRPSVDVITGLIKANVPTRIAFSVSSQVDSRTIIDISGAEKLLGRGDMLFLENGASKPVRLQGTFVSDEEIDTVVAHVREQREPEYLFEQEELLKKAQVLEEEDELFYEACEFVVDQGGASTSSLQRRFKIGYNRAARLMDLMEQQGFISGANRSKPREVYITESDLESILEAN